MSAAASDRLAWLFTAGKEDYTHGRAFHLAALKSQTAEVLDASNGTPLAVLPMPELSPYKQPLALSPDGTRLAVLSGTRLLLYTLHP